MLSMAMYRLSVILFLSGYIFCEASFKGKDFFRFRKTSLKEKEFINFRRGFSFDDFLNSTVEGLLEIPDDFALKMKKCKRETVPKFCIQKAHEKIKQELTKKFHISKISEPFHQALLFCRLLNESGICSQNLRSIYHCPEGVIQNLFHRRIYMQSNFQIAEAEGMCTGKGWDKVQELAEKGIFKNLCFIIPMLNMPRCRAEFIHRETLQYSFDDIQKFETVQKNIPEACMDLRKLDDCVMEIQNEYEETGSICLGRKDIFDSYWNVRETIIEKYYPFYPTCNVDFYKLQKFSYRIHGEHQSSNEGSEKMNDNFCRNMLAITILCLYFSGKRGA